MTTDALSPGTVIVGRYAIERLLGRGSVKHVYLALDRLSRMHVALCLLTPKPGVDGSVVARFSREARAASVLTSPFTVRVFDTGRTRDGARFLVTEAVLGRGLDEALARGPVLPSIAGTWCAQVLTALSEAHARGIVHRDVKPENVLLAPAPDDPSGEVARLTDFGLAKVLDESLEGSVVIHTAQGMIMGTPEYMPPEQWHGAALDARTDVYAAGVMLHEMLVGRPPYEGANIREICAKHFQESFTAFPEGVSDAVRAYEAVVRKALSKRPEDRFASADAMRAAIERAGGLRMPAPPTVHTPMDDTSLEFIAHVEMVSDAGIGPVQLLSAPKLVLGRAGHIATRCLPVTVENDQRARSVSRRHARIEWHGGAAFVVDLHSAGGTTVNGRKVPPDDARGVPLADGDEVGLGPHVRFVFEHAPAGEAELPAWARLTRADRYGEGLSHVLVITEATISAEPDAAVGVPEALAGGASLRVWPRDGGFVARGHDEDVASEMVDGQVWRVGAVRWTVAREG